MVKGRVTSRGNAGLPNCHHRTIGPFSCSEPNGRLGAVLPTDVSGRSACRVTSLANRFDGGVQGQSVWWLDGVMALWRVWYRA